MGSLLKNNSDARKCTSAKTPSKGQRLGWVHKSDYEPVCMFTLSTRYEKLKTYTSGPFSLNKLVP